MQTLLSKMCCGYSGRFKYCPWSHGIVYLAKYGQNWLRLLLIIYYAFCAEMDSSYKDVCFFVSRNFVPVLG